MNQKAETEKAETDTCESAVYRIQECGRKGLITANSYGDGERYEVVAKFRSLNDMQDYYSALVAIAKVGELESLVQPRNATIMGRCERCNVRLPYLGDTCKMARDDGACGGNVQLLPVED